MSNRPASRTATEPAPAFALSFSSDAVHLMARSNDSAAGRWQQRASAAFDSADFRAEMARLRALAANGPEARVALIIPDDQILYTSVPRGESGPAGLGKALDGLTPYPVDELSWDWRDDGDDGLRVAAVARQTLREAEDFARRHGFASGGFVADPAAAQFPDAPSFSDAAFGDAVAAAASVDAPQPAATADPSVTDAPRPVAEVAEPTDVATAADEAEPEAPAEPVTVAAADVPKAGQEGQSDEGPAAGMALAAAASAAPAVAEALADSTNDAAAHKAANAPADDALASDKLAAEEAAGNGPHVAASGDEAAPGPRAGVTAFLPDDMPAVAAAAMPAADPAPDAALAHMDDPGTDPEPATAAVHAAPKPLPDRARAVLDRAAAARTEREAELAPAQERHPGARGGVGGLLVMLGALLIGLLLIWSFITPDPTETAPAAVADTTAAGSATPADAASPATPGPASGVAAAPAAATVAVPASAGAAVPATTAPAATAARPAPVVAEPGATATPRVAVPAAAP